MQTQLTSTDYWDLVHVYCGPNPALPSEICMIILEMAGLCGRGRQHTFFWVYF